MDSLVRPDVLARVAIAIFAISLGSCGGGGGGKESITATPGGNSPSPPEIQNPSKFNRGLNGTIYFTARPEVNSLKLDDPKVNAIVAGEGSIDGFNVSQDGTLIALYTKPAGGNHTIKVFTSSGEAVSSFDHVEYQVSTPLISPNNQYVAFLTLPKKLDVEGAVRIYTLDGVLVRTIEDNLDEGLNAFAITWTPDGALLISSRRQGLLIVDDPLASEPRLIKAIPNDTMLHLRVSPDASKIAFSAASDRQLYVWDIGSEDFRQLTRHGLTDGNTQIVEGLDWSPDSQYIVANAYSTVVDNCLAITTFVVDQAADKAVLPDPFAPTFPVYENEDLFEIEYYTSIPESAAAGPCSRRDIEWRE